ncbi:putative transport protein [Escherichia coli]|nr:putative transport protein [Escherichia coli]
MLSDESNQQHIREAIVAMERNNQNNYWEALGKVECSDMYDVKPQLHVIHLALNVNVHRE